MELEGNPLKVLICCKKFALRNTCEGDNNLIYNNIGFKESCREYGLNVSNAVIDNAISTLCKEGFLIKKHRGEYLLNVDCIL